MDLFTQFRPLYESERDAAYEVARLKIAGKKPEDLVPHNELTSKYPVGVTRFIRVVVTLVLIAAFFPSAFRVFRAGFEAFNQSIPGEVFMAGIVGLASVMLAELGQIICTMALAVFDTSRFARGILWASVFTFTLFALVGNYEIAKPWDGKGLFPYLEAVVPTLLVVSMAYILKQQWLDTIADRHALKQKYDNAMAAYKLKYDTAEDQDGWKRTYANTLRDTLRRVYVKIGQKEEIASLTTAQWTMLVNREMRAGEWYDETITTADFNPQPTKQAQTAAQSATTVFLSDPSNPDGFWTAVCPHCQNMLGSSYSSKRSAFGSRRSHIQNMHPEKA